MIGGAKGISAKVCSFAADLPLEWDELVPDTHFLQRAQLGITEQAALPDLEYFYVLIYSGAVPVAAAYFQALRIQGKHVDAASLKPAQKMGWGVIRNIVRPRILIAGHLFRHDVVAFHTTEASGYQAFQYYEAAIKAALKTSCASAVLVKDLPDGMATYFQNHAPKFLQLRNDISMQLPIPEAWQTLHDYEKSLKHKYAQRFRKIRQPWQAIEVQELSLAEVRAHKQMLYRLYIQVSTHQQVRLGFISEDYLPLLKEKYEHALRVWAVYEGGKMVAFFSAWVKEDAFDMFYIGFDYAENARLQLYFNMLYWAVEQAIALKKPLLILGRTALDAKARLGCTPEYKHTFLYIRNSLIRRIVMQIQAGIAVQEGAWEERHPFKPKP